MSFFERRHAIPLSGSRCAVEALLTLAADLKASVAVRAIAYGKLNELKRRSDSSSPLEAYLAHRIQQFQSDPSKFIIAKPIEAPPGMPIGGDEDL